MLRWVLLLATALFVAPAAASELDSQPVHVLASGQIALSPGRAAVWQPLVGAHVGIAANSSHGGSAADVMLMPLEQWEQWQLSRADPAAVRRLSRGGNVSFVQRGRCRQEWALVIAHAWDADAYPRPQPATVHLRVTGRPCARSQPDAALGTSSVASHGVVMLQKTCCSLVLKS